jgi:hypothetical protein
MIDLKVQKQPKPKTVVGPKSTADNVATKPDTVPSQDRIRERAYALYESRGRASGQEDQDWLGAEREILNRKR